MNDVVAFGEILWDVIDGVPHLGGAPFNFAAHCSRCGLKAAIISSVGDDELGRKACEMACQYGVDVSGIAVHPSLPTGTVQVTVRNGFPSYDIRTGVAWDEIDLPAGLLDQSKPRAIYFGTLVQRSRVSATALMQILEAWKDSEMFFDVNLRQSYWSKDIVDVGLSRATVLKLNDDEQERLGVKPSSAFSECPRLKVIVVTRGADGCEVYLKDGSAFVSPAEADGPVVDTVGAGDAFSAAFLASYLQGATMKESARAGNILGGYVAARAGAIPLE